MRTSIPFQFVQRFYETAFLHFSIRYKYNNKMWRVIRPFLCFGLFLILGCGQSCFSPPSALYVNPEPDPYSSDDD